MDFRTARASALRGPNHRHACRWTLGFPCVGIAVVAVIAVIGMDTGEELERSIALAPGWPPLAGEEQERSAEEGRDIAVERRPHPGVVEYRGRGSRHDPP
jgi:hypothetical protein